MQPDRTVLLESVKNPLQFVTVGPDGAPGEVRGILDKEPTRRYYVYAKVGILDQLLLTGPRSAVSNVSGNRCESDCRSRGRKLIPGWSHTFVEIDHEIISTVILLPSVESFKKFVVSYKRKYVHKVLVNCLFKLAQEKVWLG